MYKLNNGIELPLPKYYHDKLYTEEEREKLWIIKQERGYRYIAGEKVSTENLEEWENLKIKILDSLYSALCCSLSPGIL